MRALSSIHAGLVNHSGMSEAAHWHIVCVRHLRLCRTLFVLPALRSWCLHPFPLFGVEQMQVLPDKKRTNCQALAHFRAWNRVRPSKPPKIYRLAWNDGATNTCQHMLAQPTEASYTTQEWSVRTDGFCAASRPATKITAFS